MINPVFLETYIHLCQTKSFTTTARELFMTQPGVSQHLKKIEEYFDCSLIDREQKPLEITREGHKVLNYAKELFEGHKQFVKNLKVEDPYVGELKMASPGSFGIYFYSFLLKYQRKHPKLSTQFNYAPDYLIEKDLLEGNIDVGIMARKPQSIELKSKFLAKEKLCLITPIRYKNASIEEILSLGYIDHPDGQRRFEEVFSKNFDHAIQSFSELKISGANNQIQRILEPVSMGLGFTILPEFACKAFDAQKKIFYYPLKHNVINSLYIVHKKRLGLSQRYVQLFEEFS